MVCDDNARLLHGYLDGELDLVRSLEIEEHLKGCPDCAQEIWNQQTLRKAFRSSSLYERAPKGLAERVRGAIAQESAKTTPSVENTQASDAVAIEARRETPRKATMHVLTPKRAVWNWIAVAAAILLAFVITWRILPGFGGRGNSDLLARELVSSHIRSLQPDHLYDVQSTNQHTVKPWFDGKLDYSPPVRDLAEEGFPLVGGRLDYVDHRAVAALVYQRRQHLINVFVWPEDKQTDESLRSKSLQGYNMIFWERGGMYLCAVSDLNAGELQEFSRLLQAN
ncbi:MAG TPA: anti-sigma factor [Terriglobales bacterium]|nr:anti-sigma factor [Terriglobales bacterium]